MQLIKTGILSILTLLIAFCASAQVRLSGKVIDWATLKPLPNASVFIANSTAGTKTNHDGVYTFSNLAPGNYQLLVSYVGYQTQQVDVSLVKDNDAFNITIKPKNIELTEVTVRSGTDWTKNLNLFKRDFLGTTNTAECKILNPGVLNLKFDYKTNTINASTDDFLDIENSVLGYKLRFLVKDFWANYNTNKTHYSGNVIFEPLRGNPSTEKKWAQNRSYVYEGSFRHFLVALSRGETEKSKFIIKSLIRTPNYQRPPDSIISARIKAISAQIRNRSGRHTTDSLYKWTNISAQPRLISTLGKTPVRDKDIVHPSSQNGIYSLRFSGSLYIIYKAKDQGKYNDDLYRFDEAGYLQIAAFNLKNPQKPVLFNSNGLVLTKDALFFEGSWSSLIVKLLPDDYIPDLK
jgi:hypothetical protein